MGCAGEADGAGERARVSGCEGWTRASRPCAVRRMRASCGQTSEECSGLRAGGLHTCACVSSNPPTTGTRSARWCSSLTTELGLSDALSTKMCCAGGCAAAAAAGTVPACSCCCPCCCCCSTAATASALLLQVTTCSRLGGYVQVCLCCAGSVGAAGEWLGHAEFRNEVRRPAAAAGMGHGAEARRRMRRTHIVRAALQQEGHRPPPAQGLWVHQHDGVGSPPRAASMPALWLLHARVARRPPRPRDICPPQNPRQNTMTGE